MTLIAELETNTLIISGVIFVIFLCFAKWLINRNSDKYYKTWKKWTED